MFAARSFARAAPRQALARAPARAGRRNYSSESPKQFAGTEDNEFNRLLLELGVNTGVALGLVVALVLLRFSRTPAEVAASGSNATIE